MRRPDTVYLSRSVLRRTSSESPPLGTFFSLHKRTRVCGFSLYRTPRFAGATPRQTKSIRSREAGKRCGVRRYRFRTPATVSFYHGLPVLSSAPQKVPKVAVVWDSEPEIGRRTPPKLARDSEPASRTTKRTLLLCRGETLEICTAPPRIFGVLSRGRRIKTRREPPSRGAPALFWRTTWNVNSNNRCYHRF